MATENLHEVTFIWPHDDAQIVILTGSFDNWSKSFRLTKGSKGFSGSIKIPWNKTVAYKYIVDGRWSLDESKPKRVEPEGYVNNVYMAPPNPPPQEVGWPAKPTPETNVAPLHLNGTMNGVKTEHSNGNSLATHDVPEATEVVAKVPNGKPLEQKPNGHAEMHEPQQSVSPMQDSHKAEDPSIEEGLASTPVDRHQVEDDGTKAVGQDLAGSTQAVEDKKEDNHVGLTQEPTEQPSAEVEQPAESKVEQDLSQMATTSGVKANGAPASSPDPKRSLLMSFVPVNVPPEAAVVNGNLQTNASGDDEVSTHKPLGPVPRRSLSITSATNVPEGDPILPDPLKAGTQPAEEQVVEKTPAPKEDTASATYTGVAGEALPQPETDDIPPVEQHAGAATTATATTETPASEPHTPTEVAQPTDSETIQPAVEKPSEHPSDLAPPFTPTTAEAPVEESKPSVPTSVPASPGTTLAPSTPATPTKARFPRLSRESSTPGHSENGGIRKRKSTLIEKIKHIFSHEKDKEKRKEKSRK